MAVDFLHVFFFTEKEILIDLSASFVLLIKAEIDAEHGTFSRNRHNPARGFPAGGFCLRRFERAHFLLSL